MRTASRGSERFLHGLAETGSHSRSFRATSIALTLVALVTGCGSGAPASSTAHEPPRETPALAPWSFSIPVVSGEESADDVARDGDAWVLAFGRVRVRVSESETTVAQDAPATDILGIVHVGERWLFVTRGGEVLVASTPLGTLSVLGAMDGQRLGAIVGRTGRLAVLDARGTLYVATDDALVRVPTEGPVVDAVFSDAEHGVRIEASGQLMQTADAGAHWTAVALPPDAGFPAVVFQNEGERVVSTDVARDFVLSAEGALRELSDAEVDARFGHDASEGGPSDELVARARARARIGGALRTGVSASGRVLVSDGAGRGHVAPNGPSLALPEAYVPISWWGERLVYASNGVWYESDGTSAFTPMRWQSPAQAIVDPSGRRWVMRGRCPSAPYAAPAPTANEDDEDDEDDDDDDDEDDGSEDDESPAGERDYDSERTTLCVVEGDRPRAISVDSLWELIGISGDTLYVDTDTQDGMRLVSVDLATGTSTVLADPALFRGGVTEDGVLFGSGGSDESPWRVGPPGAMVELSLPGPTERTTRDDRPHVVAIDRDRVVASLGHDVWVSIDGGHTFTEAPAPTARAARELTRERCGPRACDLGDVIWAPEGLDVLPHVSVVHADGAPVLDRYEDGDHAPSEIAVACDAPQPWSGHPLVPMLPSRQGHRSLFAGGALEIAGSPTTSWTEGDLSGRLSGNDATGAFDVPILRGRVAPVRAIAHVRTTRVSTSLLAATRSVGVLFRARAGDGHQESDLVAVGPGLAPTVVGPLGELARTFSFAPEPRAALPLPDGSIAVHVSVNGAGWDVPSYRPDVIVRFAPDGTSSVHRFESGAVRTTRLLARDASGHAGLLAVRRNRSDFLGLDGSVRGPLPAFPGTIVEVCGARAPDDVDVVLPGGSASRLYLQAQTDAPFTTATFVATLRADGSACLREGWAQVSRGPLSPVNEQELDFVRGPIGFVAEGGALVGRELAADGTASAPFPCVLPEEHEVAPGTTRIGVAPLAGGDLALALEREGSMVLGRLHGTTWDTVRVATERAIEEGEMWALVRDASEPTVARGAARVTRAGVVADEGLVGLAGGTRFVVASAGGEGEGRRGLVAIRADGTRTAPLELGERIPIGVLASTAGTGGAADALAGVLFTAEMVLDVDYFTLGNAQVQRIGLGAGGLSIGTAVPGSSEGSVLASGDRLAWLRRALRARDAHGEERPVTLELLALDGARPAPLGPALAGTQRWVEPVALAAFVGARTTRVAYLDGTTMRAPTHVRVVELRDGAWWDVAPPLRIEGAAAAWLDATSAIVVTSEGSAARLVDGAWTPMPFSLPAPAAPSPRE